MPAIAIARWCPIATSCSSMTPSALLAQLGLRRSPLSRSSSSSGAISSWSAERAGLHCRSLGLRRPARREYRWHELAAFTQHGSFFRPDPPTENCQTSAADIAADRGPTSSPLRGLMRADDEGTLARLEAC